MKWISRHVHATAVWRVSSIFPISGSDLFTKISICAVFPESAFVECTVCEDYDLCVQCLLDMKHGHNPNHGFKAATADTIMDDLAQALCAPGRNLRHYALCDGCDKVCWAY